MQRVEFTKEMKKTHKILFPNMCEIHFSMLQKMFQSHGYDVELLKTTDQSLVDVGLKYVHNDTCYPALLTIGQMISALQSGRYDVNRTALMMTQTGGGCRASNYIHLLRKALAAAGLAHVPVISVNISGLERQSGFTLSLAMLRQAVAVLVYGDLLMLLHNQTRPYECESGRSEALVDSWTARLSEQIEQKRALGPKEMARNMRSIVLDFQAVEREEKRKTKVGVVGEIYVKYSALANNQLEKFLYEQDCETMVPGILAFMLFKVDNRLEDIRLYGGSAAKKTLVQGLFRILLRFETLFLKALEGSTFTAPTGYAHLKKLVKPFIGYGCKMGEGWLLTAEMIELIELGYQNIVCAQPFGCLPNHIVGKGMIRAIRSVYPEANIVPIDFDPGATKVNQENRIKLMLAVAARN